MQLSFKNIAPLLNTNKNRLSKWFSYFGLGIGVLLLLTSMQMFVNINSILKENNPRKNGFDFFSITKVITNENMGQDNTFKPGELAAIQNHPSIVDAAPLISNQYRVKASAGSIIPLSTDLFLESIEDGFLDTIPPGFTWQPGDATVPLIFSTDFLELYNVFAPAQDMPQVSAKTISSVNIILEISGATSVRQYSGNVVALTDRINSVLVPKSFMEWSNRNFAGITKVDPSRIYIKTKDANNPQLISFLDANNYHLNKEKTKFGRIKAVLQNIISGLGIFGILVIMLALMLFSFYLQLMIARSKENLQLLLMLGYSPNWLSKTVAKTWIPVYMMVVIIAVILTAVLHYTFVKISFPENNDLSLFVHWSVLAIAVILLALSIFTNYRLVRKELYKIA